MSLRWNGLDDRLVGVLERAWLMFLEWNRGFVLNRSFITLHLKKSITLVIKSIWKLSTWNESTRNTYLVSTNGVLGRLGTFSFSCVLYSSAVGVFDLKRIPDLGLSPELEDSFLYLLLDGEPLELLLGAGKRPRWMVMAASKPREQSFRTYSGGEIKEIQGLRWIISFSDLTILWDKCQ